MSKLNNQTPSTYIVTNHPIYKVYKGMKRRCYNKNDNSYKNYGGRGIYVCEEWVDNPRVFIDWCLVNNYKEGLLLDRIDNNDIYSPNNCRFVTYKISANNTSRNHLLSYNGETHSMAEWCDIMNMPYQTLRNRIRKGWDIERTITQPARKYTNRSKVC